MHMTKTLITAGLLSLLAGTASASDSVAYEVTVTNLTKGQILSPVLVAAHGKGVELYQVGMPASPELAAVAENADYAGLVAALESDPRVSTPMLGNGVILPGASDTVTVMAMEDHDMISLVAMLVTTNDGFIGLSGVSVGKGKKTIMAPALDAGSEYNSEDCAHIPGPPCGSPFQSPAESGEGFVYVHSGIHGIADLDPAMLDWNNPVAKVTIKRMK